MSKAKFGLVAQGHIPTIERMLEDFGTATQPYYWRVIGQEIGWDGMTAALHYLEYLRTKAFGRRPEVIYITPEEYLCNECGKNPPGETDACSGAFLEEQMNGVDQSGTNGPLPNTPLCNCCKECREKCVEAYRESLEGGPDEITSYHWNTFTGRVSKVKRKSEGGPK